MHCHSTADLKQIPFLAMYMGKKKYNWHIGE